MISASSASRARAMNAHVRLFALPHGYTAKFHWQDGHLEIEWSPAFPRIRKHRAWRKFVAAYQAARREFYTDVAAMIGGNVLIVDTDLKTIDGMELIPVPTKQ